MKDSTVEVAIAGQLQCENLWYEGLSYQIILSASRLRYGMNSITVISYYKCILRNITRVIYRNQNKRF